MSIKAFFNPERVYGVVGASSNESKFGYKVFNWYLLHDLPTIPINPTSSTILNVPVIPNIIEAIKYAKETYPNSDGLSLSFITPPKVSDEVLENINAEGVTDFVKGVWFQPGAFSYETLEKAKDLGINVVIGQGACILVSGDDEFVESKLKANL